MNKGKEREKKGGAGERERERERATKKKKTEENVGKKLIHDQRQNFVLFCFVF